MFESWSFSLNLAHWILSSLSLSWNPSCGWCPWCRWLWAVCWVIHSPGTPPSPGVGGNPEVCCCSVPEVLEQRQSGIKTSRCVFQYLNHFFCRMLRKRLLLPLGSKLISGPPTLIDLLATYLQHLHSAIPITTLLFCVCLSSATPHYLCCSLTWAVRDGAFGILWLSLNPCSSALLCHPRKYAFQPCPS